MHPLLFIEFAVLSMFYALVWHDKSPRDPERPPVEPRAFVPRSNESPHLNWEMLAIWSFVAVSFAAFFFAGYVIWAKCHGN